MICISLRTGINAILHHTIDWCIPILNETYPSTNEFFENTDDTKNYNDINNTYPMNEQEM